MANDDQQQSAESLPRTSTSPSSTPTRPADELPAFMHRDLAKHPLPTPEEIERKKAERLQWERERREQDREYERRRREEYRLHHIARLRETSGVPLRFSGAEFANMIVRNPAHQAVADRVRELIGKPAMLALLGPRGTGKTFMASALIHAFCEAERSARYVRLLDFFLAIRRTYGGERGASEEKIIADAAAPDLLVIDEMADRHGTDWEATMLTNLIDQRYADCLPTLMISNQGPDEFSKRIGESIASRMAEIGGVIVCNWPTFRVPGATPAPVMRPQPRPATRHFREDN